MLSYFLLALSIGLELFATTMLKASDGFTRPLQTVACVLGYVGSFYTLTHVLKYIPLSVTYATWSGVGLVVTALISVFIFSAVSYTHLDVYKRQDRGCFRHSITSCYFYCNANAI